MSMRISIAPQETAVDLELDEIQKTAALGPDPQEATPNTPAWRIREQRIAVRAALERVLTLESGREQDLPASLKGEVAKALDAARQHLRGVTEAAHDQAVNVMRQLAAHRSRAVADDHRLSDDGRETRRLRREQILDRLANLNDETLHAAIEDDDEVAEAVVTAAAWRTRSLNILPTTLQAAADRLFERRAPQQFGLWRAAQEQTRGLRHEVDMAASAAVTEVQESDITAN